MMMRMNMIRIWIKENAEGGGIDIKSLKYD